MRFIYCGSFRLPNNDAAAARVLNVARAIRAAGHEVSFISWGGAQREEDMCDDGVFRYDGFPYVVTNELDFKGNLYTKVEKKIRQGQETKKILRQRLGQYEAIITYNCSLIRWLVPFCRKKKIRLVSDITEWYDYSELKFFERPWYYYDMHYVQKKIKNKIVISSYLDNYYNNSNNLIIPATCDASEEKWSKQEVTSLLNNNGEVTLIYAGNPAKKDAVHYVIKAVDKLAREDYPIRFLILGITKERYVKKYHSFLPKGELHRNVIFLGRVSQDDVPSYYSIADFMVLLREPTRKSNAGFPTKFAESFTSGTPVIANLTSDLSSYLRDGITGFVVSEPSEESIYLTLKEKVLLLNREDIDDIKKNVRAIAYNLDYHAYVEALRSFIDKLK